MRRMLGVCLVLVTGTSAWAQLPGSDVRVTRDEAARLLERSLDTQIVLTTGPGVGSGYFTLDDAEVDVTRFSLTVRLPPRRAPATDEVDPAGDYFERLELSPHVRVRIRAAVGLTEGRDPVPFLADYGAEGEVVTTTVSYRGGLGIDFNLGSVARLTPICYLAWTKATAIADGDVLGRSILGVYYDEVLVNWRMEAITFMPGVVAEVSLPVDPLKVDLTASATYMHSRTLSATSELQEIQTHSFVTRESIAIDIPLGFAIFDYPVHVRPGVGHLFMVGDVRSGNGGTHHFVTPFVDLIARTDTLIATVLESDGWPRMMELGVSGSLVFGQQVFGWDVGAAVQFEF